MNQDMTDIDEFMLQYWSRDGIKRESDFLQHQLMQMAIIPGNNLLFKHCS
jgi:hypothetical protein